MQHPRSLASLNLEQICVIIRSHVRQIVQLLSKHALSCAVHLDYRHSAEILLKHGGVLELNLAYARAKQGTHVPKIFWCLAMLSLDVSGESQHYGRYAHCCCDVDAQGLLICKLKSFLPVQSCNSCAKGIYVFLSRNKADGF